MGLYGHSAVGYETGLKADETVWVQLNKETQALYQT
jgi:hypothetical protein